MAQGVDAGMLLDAGLVHRLVHGALHAGFVDVMTHLPAGLRIGGAAGSGEDVLPARRLRRVGVLAGERIGQSDCAEAGLQVCLMEPLRDGDLRAQRRFQPGRQRHDAVLIPLAVEDGDLPVAEVHVLDAQTEAFAQAHAGAVEQAEDEVIDAFGMGEDGLDLVAGEDNGHAARALRPGEVVHALDRDVQHVAVEEEHGAEGDVLGVGRDVPVGGEVGEVGADGRGAVMPRVIHVEEAAIVERVEHIRLFGASAHMADAQCLTQLAEGR